MLVYLLTHAPEDDEYREDAKTIGVYSSWERAEEAKRRLSPMPGFKDWVEGFEILELTLDEDNEWQEGFISWAEASPPPAGSPRYDTLVGSDLQRDGMFLELREVGNEASPLLEVFFSDATQAMTLTAFSQDIEVGLVEDAIGEAWRRLPPKKKADE